MIRITETLLAVALLALALTGWRWSVSSDELASAQRVIGTLSAGIESRDKAITRLKTETTKGRNAKPRCG